MKAVTKKTLKSMYGILEQMHADLESINDTESDAHQEKSEKWQESDKGQANQEKLNEIENALGYVYDAMQALDNATQEDEA